jgi:hypothetical protein
VWAVTHAGSDAPFSLVVARGRFEEGDARTLSDVGEVPPGVETHGRFTIITRSEGALSLIGDHTLIIGELPQVRAALDRQVNGDGAGPTELGLKATMERIGFRQATIAGAVLATEELLRALEVPPMLQSTLESAAFAANVSDRVTGALTVRTTGAMMAATLATLVRGQLSELGSDPGIAALGLAPLFAAVNVTNQGPDAWLRFELGEADLVTLGQGLTQAFGVAVAPQ